MTSARNFRNSEAQKLDIGKAKRPPAWPTGANFHCWNFPTLVSRGLPKQKLSAPAARFFVAAVAIEMG
jgi:hypothetical protein